jgi:signal peptidase I
MTKEEQQAKGQSWLVRIMVGRNPKFTLLRMLVWVALLLILGNFVFLPIRIQGISMLPTYRESGVNLVNCLVYRFHPPQRGDVVAIQMAGKHLMLCKRIVGLPGETISFHQGRLYIDGRPLPEPYLKLPCNWELAPQPIGDNEYYVVGDNRSMDFHDHTQGRAERDRIVGRLML